MQLTGRQPVGKQRQHGGSASLSQLLDAVVAAKPKIDHPRFRSFDEIASTLDAAGQRPS